MEAIHTFGTYQINMTIKNEEIKAVGNKNENNVFHFSFKHILPFKVQQILGTWQSAEEGAGRRGMGGA